MRYSTQDGELTDKNCISSFMCCLLIFVPQLSSFTGFAGRRADGQELQRGCP